MFNITELKDIVNAALERLVTEASCSVHVKDCVRHSVLLGGKRFRPSLLLALVQDFGGDASAFVGAAVPYELLHCASLIHDDLPALDNDDMRRGFPSSHKKFGEATAILSADWLIAYALQLLTRVPLSDPVRVQLVARAANAFAALCDGQQLDLLDDEREDHLDCIYRLKTGALLSAVAASAAVVSDLDDEATQSCAEFGSLLGLHFQLVDDFIDRFGSAEERGRARRSDEQNERRTPFTKLNRDGAELTLSRKLDQLEAALRSVELATIGGRSALTTRNLMRSVLGRLSS